MNSVRLRFLADINPPTPAFDKVANDASVTFMPLETVWADDRLDTSRIRPKSEVAGGYVRFQNFDVLCPKVTPTFQAGRSAHVGGLVNGVGAATTEVHVLRSKPTVADPRYVRYALLTKPFLEEGVSRFQGVAGLQRVPEDFVQNFRVNDRPLDEQRRIADFLDDQIARIDQAGALRQGQLTTLEERRAASFTRVFAGVSATVRLSRLLEDSGVGVVVNPSSYFVEEGVPFVHGYNVRDGWFDLEDLKRMSDADSRTLSRTRLRPGDVLVVRAGYPGRSAVVTDDLAGGNCASVLVLRPNAELLPGYLSAFFNSSLGKAQVEAAQYGAAQGVVNLSDVRAFALPQVDVARQVSALRVLDADLAAGLSLQRAQEGALSLLEERKRSLITAAVTGELDVSTGSSRAAEAVVRG